MNYTDNYMMFTRLGREPRAMHAMRAVTTILMTTLALSLGGIASFGLSGCAGKGIDNGDPARLYEEAEADIKSDHYQIAIDKLREIRNKFPYSKYATEAQLRMADVYFLQESYGEAAVAYESFKDLHPKHEKVGYAMFRIGKSHYNDTPTNIARDMTPAVRALDAYGEFLQRFPNATEEPEARTDVKNLRERLADKELYIGRFYYKQDDYLAAHGRLTKIMQVYGDTPAAKQAQALIAKIPADKLKTNAPAGPSSSAPAPSGSGTSP